MKRRIVALFLVIAMLCMYIPQLTLTAQAATSGTCGNNLKWSFDEKSGILTITGSGDMADWDYDVLTPWIAFAENIRTILLPSNLTSIGNCAFYACENLTDITIPGKVTRIGDNAFFCCSGLTSITIPDSVKSIGEHAFEGCGMKTVTVPSNVVSMGEAVFSCCMDLTEIVVDSRNPNYCSKNGVLFNKSMTVLMQCPTRKSGSYQVPNGVTSISGRAFYNCEDLTSIQLPDGVTSIDHEAFGGCISIKSITLPDSLRTIGCLAFYCCFKLKSITIPRNVTFIDYEVFIGCESLTAINVDPQNQSYCSKDGVLFDKNMTTLIQCPCTKSGEYKIPGSVLIIEEFAFSECKGLTDISIPYGVSYIGYGAFEWCDGIREMTIPRSVTRISGYAFSGCVGLKSILMLCDSVTTISAELFSYCTSLTSVTIPDSVTCIEMWAFEHCSNLKSVTIPAGVTSIEEESFRECGNLSDVYYLGTKEAWKKISIGNGNDPLLKANIHCKEPNSTAGAVFPADYDFYYDSYSFTNFTDSIPKKYFTSIFGRGKGKSLYNKKKDQGGMCFGMSYTTAAIINRFPVSSELRGMSLNTSKILIGSKIISLRDYIRYAHIYQYSKTYANGEVKCQNANELLQNVKLMTDHGKTGIAIGMNKKDGGAHLVLAVGYEGNDILIDDPNWSDNPQKLTVYPDGSWSFEGFPDYNSTNCDIAYNVDYSVPYQLLLSGRTVEADEAALAGSTSIQDTYIEGMDILDEDSSLLYIGADDCRISDPNAVEIKAYEAASEEQIGGKFYWTSDTVSVYDIEKENTELEFAGNDMILSTSTGECSEVQFSLADEPKISLEGVDDGTCGFTVESWASPENDLSVRLELTGTAVNERVVVKKQDDGLKVSGLSDAAAVLYIGDKKVDSLDIPNADGVVKLLYDDTGRSDELSTASAQPDHDDICPSGQFSDAPAYSNWAHEGIDYCIEHELMNGVGGGLFNPNGTVTRAQLVTILYRVADQPEVTTAGTFGDVPSGKWYSDAIEWAAANKIVNGVGDGKFDPMGNITREQIATILYRYEGSPKVTGTLASFPDSGNVHSYAVDALVWATGEGLINGVKSGDVTNLAPLNNATRAQIASIIMRYLDS